MENEEELISDLTPEEESAELAARRDYEGEIIAIIRSNASPKLMRENWRTITETILPAFCRS